jgi:hypothetical protein
MTGEIQYGEGELVPRDLIPKVCEPSFRSDGRHDWNFIRNGSIALIGTSPDERGAEFADLVHRAPDGVQAWENSGIWLDTNDPYSITLGNVFAEVAQNGESSRTFTQGIHDTLEAEGASVPFTESLAAKLGLRFPNAIQHAWWTEQPDHEALARLSALGYRLIGAEAVSKEVFTTMVRAVHAERLPREFVYKTARYLSSLIPKEIGAGAAFYEFGTRQAD